MAAGIALELHEVSNWRMSVTFHFKTWYSTSTCISCNTSSLLSNSDCYLYFYLKKTGSRVNDYLTESLLLFF